MKKKQLIIFRAIALVAILIIVFLTNARAGQGMISISINGAPKITSITPMDRWIDLSWNYLGNAPGGFDVSVSKDGHDFKSIERVGPDAYSASVYVTDQIRSSLGSGSKLFLRVAVLDANGKSLSVSVAKSVLPAKPHDIESEVRKRFDYFNDRRPYNLNDPAYTVVYSDEQKQLQRFAARKMFAELQKKAANSAGSREFTIPKGIYRVDPGQMLLTGVKNFTIRAPNVEIIVDADRRGAAFSFERCSNITLTGRGDKTVGGLMKGESNLLMIDSEQLPMSVSRILACDLTEKTIDVEVLPGYEMKIPDKERMLAYNLQGQMLNVVQMGWDKVTPLEGRKLRLNSTALNNPLNTKTILIPGNLLALHHLGAGGNEVCTSRNCKDMTFESIRMVDGGGQPFDHTTTGRTVYRDWRLMPRQGTSRLPISAGLGQFSKNGGTFIFENCEFGPHLDDGINLLSGMSIVGKTEPEKKMIITGGQRPTIGSTLTFYDYKSWVKFGAAKVMAVEEVSMPEVLTEVNNYAASNRTVKNAKLAYRTTFDKEVTVNPFAMVVFSDYRADSIIVRGCLFRDMLAQIMLLQGAKYGLIENNLLLRSTGGAISAQFAQYWWEGPMPSNFMIRNNMIRDNPVLVAVNGFSGNGAIAVFCNTVVPINERLMTNFRIEGNLIINPSVYGIVIRNTDQVVIRHNRIINPGAQEIVGSFRGKPISELYAAFCFDAVSHAVVTDNEIVFGNPRCQRAFLIEPNCDASTMKFENNHETPFKSQ